MFYKVFIDDSGNKDFSTPYTKDFIKNPPIFDNYEKFWRDNYFILCGVRISQEHIGGLNQKINKLKKKYFKTHKVEIKSDWLRNPHQREKYYLSQFDIKKDELVDFVDSIYELITNNKDKLKLIATVFDKRFYGDKKRQSGEGNPLAKSSQIIFERLQYLNTYHIVVFDQMESSLRIDKGQHGKILKVLRDNVGMKKIFVKNYDKIVDIKFIKSDRENFLQIADLCAYNVYRQFTHYGREWLGEKKNKNDKFAVSTYKYFDKIRCNFLHLPKGVKKKVCGVGLVCIPDINKVQWNVLYGCDIENTKKLH